MVTKITRAMVKGAISSQVGPNSTERMTGEIMKVKNPSISRVKRIVSDNWGPNITGRIMSDLKRKILSSKRRSK